MAKTYDTILDEIAKQMEAQGDITHRASFRDDAVRFGIKGWTDNQKTQDQQAATNNANNSNKTDLKRVPTNANQFKDDNKQLALKPSSTIQSAAYWQKRQYLIVSFKSGHTYSYSDVPIQTIQLWEWSSSAGSFFYHNIRLSYNYQKLG